MTEATMVAKNGLRTRPSGSTSRLAIAIGTELNAANHIGWYGDLTVGAEKLLTKVGGILAMTIAVSSGSILTDVVGNFTACSGTAKPIVLSVSSGSDGSVNIGANNTFSGTGNQRMDVIGSDNNITLQSGGSSLIIGRANTVGQANITVVGTGFSFSSGANSTYIGAGSFAQSTDNGVWIGQGLNTSGAASSSVVIGRSADSSSASSVCIGRAVSAGTSVGAIVIGHNGAASSAAGSISIGSNTTAATAASCSGAAQGIAIGTGSVTGARSTAANAIAIGGNNAGNAAAASGAASIAFGVGTVTAHTNSVAIGLNSASTKNNQIVLGTSSFTEVLIPATTVSSSSTSGALVVAGGVGIARTLVPRGGTADASENTIIGANVAVPVSQTVIVGDLAGAAAGSAARDVFIGYNARSTGASDDVVAVGHNASVGNGTNGAMAIGSAASASHVNGVAIGYQAATTKSNQLVLGNAGNHTEVFIPTTTAASSTTIAALVVSGGIGVAGAGFFGGEVSASSAYRFGTQTVLVGNYAVGAGTNPIAIGSGTDATTAPQVAGSYGIAVGAGSVTGARAAADNAVAIGGSSVGNGASAAGLGSVAVGSGSSVVAGGSYGIAIGTNARNLTGAISCGIAIGGSSTTARSASAGGQGAVAIGATTGGANGARGYGKGAVAIGGSEGGNGAYVSGDGGVAIGQGAASVGYSISIGVSATATAGVDAVAIGRSATAGVGEPVAIGLLAAATGNYATAIGRQSAASATNALAIGLSTSASAVEAIAIGSRASSGAPGAIAIGAGPDSSLGAVVTTNASYTGAIAIGGGNGANRGALASNDGTVSIGGANADSEVGSLASGRFAVAIGTTSTSSARAGVALGYAAAATNGNYSIAIGNSASANSNAGEGAIAIGRTATVAHADSIAIGRGSASTKANQMVLGAAANITEVFIPTTTVSNNSTSGALVVSGGVGIAGSVHVSLAVNAATLTLKGATSGSASITVADVAGTPTTLVLPSVNGTAGQVLQNDGSGVLSWATVSGGTPGGSNTEIQFNNSGAFAGDSTFTFSSATKKVSVRYLQFEITATDPTHAEGCVYWNSTDKTLNLMSEISGSVLQVGQENWVRIVNKTGAQLDDGKVVYISGAQGNRPTAAYADADLSTADRVLGVCTADISDNAEGYITTFGIVRGVNTASWAAGDVLYLSSTAGVLTNVKPTVPAHAVRIGYALNSTASGSIFVSPLVGAELSELHDVTLSTPTAGDVLRYDGTKWLNDSAVPVANDTQVLFNDGGTFHSTSGLTFDKTTSALSITGDLTAGGALRTDDAFYMGDPTQDGTFKFMKSGNDLLIQRRESGSYVTKTTIYA